MECTTLSRNQITHPYKSNHPPTTIKNLPASIGRRISDLPQNEEILVKQNRTTRKHLNTADTMKKFYTHMNERPHRGKEIGKEK